MSLKPLVIIEGGEGVERAMGLLRALNNAAINMEEFGQVLIKLMQLEEKNYQQEAAEYLQGYIRQFYLHGEEHKENPSFDQHVVIEALNYASRVLRREWDRARHPFTLADYQFKRWLRHDLMLEPA